jgi:DNA-binding NtrC family response regulator
MASRSSGVDCVFLSCFDHNAQFFASMLGPGGIRLHRACTVEMADFLLLATRGTVLVSDTTFLDGSWEDALAMIRTVHPLVATVICADLIDAEFVASAQERGAFAVLWRPVELEQLRSRIRAADELTRERRLWLAERGRGHERQSDQKFVPEFQWKR